MVAEDRKHSDRHASKGNVIMKKKKKEQQMQKKALSFILPKSNARGRSGVQWETPNYQARWLTGVFDSALGSSLSELEHSPPLPEDSFVQLQPERERDSKNLCAHVKKMFGDPWVDAFCTGEGSASNKEKGSPALLILCSSAARCVELLKGLRSLTKACKPAKLFAKHIKVEEQVKALENYVNIAVGTPNRVKKLIDIGALGLGSLSIVLLDMCEDAKGLTLFTIPQVKADCLELYKSHFYQQASSGKIKFCFY